MNLGEIVLDWPMFCKVFLVKGLRCLLFPSPGVLKNAASSFEYETEWDERTIIPRLSNRWVTTKDEIDRSTDAQRGP